MNKYRIEYKAGNLLGSQLIFADKKVDAIKTFLRGQNKSVLINKITYDGHLRTNQGLSSIYVK